MTLEKSHREHSRFPYLSRAAEDGWEPHTLSPMRGTTIHPTSWLAPWVTVGANCRIGPNCTIGWEGFGYEQAPCGLCDPNDTTCPPCPRTTWRRRPHEFGVVIGDNVDIGAGTVIDRGRYRDTVIGNGTKIDANVFIAHNCLIGDNCLIIANSQISGSCEIGNRCHIGPAAMLTDHINVGDGGRCGLGAVVIRDVPAGVTVVGNPARDIAERRQKPTCERTGQETMTERDEWLRGMARQSADQKRAQELTEGSHGDIETGLVFDVVAAARKRKIAEGLGDGSDEFSLPVPRPDFSELSQRQRAAAKGWMGAERSSGRR